MQANAPHECVPLHHAHRAAPRREQRRVKRNADKRLCKLLRQDAPREVLRVCGVLLVHGLNRSRQLLRDLRGGGAGGARAGSTPWCAACHAAAKAAALIANKPRQSGGLCAHQSAGLDGAAACCAVQGAAVRGMTLGSERAAHLVRVAAVGRDAQQHVADLVPQRQRRRWRGGRRRGRRRSRRRRGRHGHGDGHGCGGRRGACWRLRSGRHAIDDQRGALDVVGEEPAGTDQNVSSPNGAEVHPRPPHRVAPDDLQQFRRYRDLCLRQLDLHAKLHRGEIWARTSARARLTNVCPWYQRRQGLEPGGKSITNVSA